MSAVQMTNSDWIAIAAVIIALCALVSSLWLGLLTRKHNILSSKPLVEVNIATSSEKGVGIYIANNGLGPAILQNVTALFRGNDYNLLNENEHSAFLKKIMPAQEHINFLSRHMLSGTSLGAKQEAYIFVLDERDVELIQFAKQSLSDVIITVGYECIYKRQYSTIESHVQSIRERPYWRRHR